MISLLNVFSSMPILFSNKMTIFSWTLLACLLCSSEAYEILVAFPYPIRSHNNLGNGVVRHLLKAGHEVTYITPFPLETADARLHQVDVSSNILLFPANSIVVHKYMNNEMSLDDDFLHVQSLRMTNFTFYNENVVNLLNDPKQNFDAVVVEWMFSEVLSGLGAVFDCPYIWVYPYEPNAISLSLIDETTNPAYVPHMISTNVAPFTFLQRVEELYKYITSVTRKFYYYSRFEKDVYETIFTSVLEKRGRTLPPYDLMRYNASLMLGCSHVTLGLPIRLPQNYKDIGGYYIDEQVKPLSNDIQKLMDEAEYGVIYFSMGTNVKSKDLPPVVKSQLLNLFAEMKQTVLWKFEEDFEDVPKNVHLLKWAPQQSILDHKNCVLFISHGGLLSSTEAVHFGVPIVGIPVFVDQFNNIDRAVKKGYAKRVDLTYMLADDLKTAIEDVLRDPRYTTKAKQLSMAYHDRLMGPGPEMVHWVEHVVRTRGAPHLRSPALHVPLYQKLYLDLAATLLLILILFSIVLKKMHLTFSKDLLKKRCKKNK